MNLLICGLPYGQGPQKLSLDSLELMGMRIDSWDLKFRMVERCLLKWIRFLLPYKLFLSPDYATAVNVLKVFPTRTVYVFQKAGVQLTFTFMTPMIPDDEHDLISRPVTYLQYLVAM